MFSLSDLAVDNSTSYDEGHEHLLSQVLTGSAACLAQWSQQTFVQEDPLLSPPGSRKLLASEDLAFIQVEITSTPACPKQHWLNEVQAFNGPCRRLIRFPALSASDTLAKNF